MLDLDFFLGKKYYKAAYELSHRLYQYKDELPEHDPLVDVPGYDGPKVTFSGDRYADIYTNVYRVNMMDMAYQKVDDEGGTHTSSPGALNFGCYIGMGTFNQSEAYGDHIWTRDIGRLLMEIIDAGYFDRAKIAVDDLHKWLYADSKKYKHPHWKRIANHNFDSIQGKENDGHAAVMLAIYTLYNKGAVDDAWLAAHKQHLIDAGDWFVWQVEHPEESNFDRVLFSESETSTQTHGGYDLFSSIIASEALKCYAKLLDIIGERGNCKKLCGNG